MKLMQLLEACTSLVNPFTKQQYLALTTLAHVFDTIGLEASDLDVGTKGFDNKVINVKQSNVVTDVYWVATIETGDGSTWSMKLSYRQSLQYKPVRFHKSVYNQMCCRGTQIHQIVADIAKLDKYLTIVSKAIPLFGDDGDFAQCRINSSMFDALLSIYSDLMLLEHNEFPAIIFCKEEDFVVIKYSNCWFRLTADSGPWDNSKHIIQIYDDRGGNVTFDTSYNDKHKALIQAVLRANNIVSEIGDSTTSLWQIPENLWVEK